MNTQAQLQELHAGESCSPAGSRIRHAVLARGQVLVQPPARLLAGTIVFPPAARYEAPAQWDWEEGSCVVAVDDASLVLQRSPSVMQAVRSLLPTARTRQAMPAVLTRA